MSFARVRESLRCLLPRSGWRFGLVFFGCGLLPAGAQIPPTIVVEPQDAYACVAGTASFYVEANGDQPITFTWFRNGAPVFSGVVSTPTNSTLTLTNVTIPDDGSSFYVHVTNPFGGKHSTTNKLHVGVVPLITQQPTNQAVPLLGTITFSVKAVPVVPALDYRWWFQGNALTNGGRISGADTPDLVITNAQVSDAGYYRAVVTNSCFTLNSVPARCDITPEPMITNQPFSQTVPFQTTVQFSVGVLGPPPMFYQWYRNDAPIPGGIGPVLTLPNVERPDVGVYHVVVSRLHNATASERVELEVELTLEGSVIPREEATDYLESLTNALRTSISQPTVIFHGVPLLFNTYDATTETWETAICGLTPSHTMWVLYYSPRAEVTKVSTEGSDFDTMLGVYTWDGYPDHNPVSVACDNDSGYDGRDSLVYFPAQANRNYYIAVDGVRGATGTVRLQVGEIIRRARFTEDGSFRFEMAGPYWLNNTLRSSTGLNASAFQWQTLLTMPATNRDWVVGYTNSNPGVDSQRFYGASASQN